MSSNTSKKKIIILLVVLVIVLAVVVFLLWQWSRKNSGKSYLRVSSFNKRLVSNANSELSKWQYGAIKENNPNALDTLQTYWKVGAGVNLPNQSAVDDAWSAAFISYLMKSSGAGADFPYSSSHSTYITQTIQNRKQNSSNPFKGYRVNEVALSPGDLLCYSRAGSGANYDTQGNYTSHCDVVVNVDGSKAEKVGGNVSNSVSKTSVELTSDGKVDISKEKNPYFVVIKNTK